MFNEKSTINGTASSFNCPINTPVDMSFITSYGLQDSDFHSMARIKSSS